MISYDKKGTDMMGQGSNLTTFSKSESNNYALSNLSFIPEICSHSSFLVNN